MVVVKMENLSIRIGEVSGYLQSLASPKFNSQVEQAVEKKDKESLIKICRNAKIPDRYLSTIVSTLLSMSSPMQKYPDWV
jgi:NADPH-dependent 7-cyano-7-deazaguanine reductase QueF